MSTSKRSLTAQLLAEQKRIEEGGSPTKRKKGTSPELIAFAGSEDSDDHKEEEPLVEYEFVEGDDQGEELFSLSRRNKPKRKRGPASLGPSPKIPTDVRIDATGEWLNANDGKVRINLHKAILRQPTEDDLLSS